MASIKTGTIALPTTFQLEIYPGWFLDINVKSNPSTYCLTHGKKSMMFHPNITKDRLTRNFGVRLVKGRKQMIIPPAVLCAFPEHETFLTWYDP